MTLSAVVSAPPTIFVVVKTNTAGTSDLHNQCVFLSAPSSGTYGSAYMIVSGNQGVNSPTYLLFQDQTPVYNAATATFPGINQLFLMTGVYDTTKTSVGLQMSVNGTAGTPVTAYSTVVTPTVTRIGNVEYYAGFTTCPSTVTVGEIVVFNTALSTSQRQQVEGYLAAKWGLTMQLPATHPYSAVVPFLPTQIAGCQLWLDAADSSTITGTSPVTAWRDKSGTGRSVGFNGTNTYTSSPASVNTNGSTAFFQANADFRKSTVPNASLFLVYKWNNSTAGTNQTLWGTDRGGGNNRGQVLSFPANTSIQYGLTISGSAPNSAIVSGINNGNLLMYNANYSLGVVNGTFVNVNGSLSTSLVTEGVADPQTSFDGIAFGAVDNEPRFPSAVSFSEIIFFNTALSASQRNQVEQYLGQKWKISVANAPSPGPYIIPYNRPFYPTDIPGCSLWLDAADRSSVMFSPGTSNVTQWNDKSGNGNYFTVTEGTPVYSTTTTAAALPCVLFPANSQMLSTSNAAESGGSSRTMFFVTDCPNPSQTNMGTGSIGTANGCIGYNYNTVGAYPQSIFCPYTYSSGDRRFDIASSSTYSTTMFIGYVGYNSNTTTIYGNFATASTDNSVVQALNITAGPWYMGDRPASGTTGYGGKSTSNARICEFLDFNTFLSTQQRQQVEQYLAQKWGLVANLPPGHPGKLMPAFSTGFTPKSVAGMQLWLDAGDTSVLTLSGTSVTSWGDKSGNGYNMNILTAPPFGYTSSVYPTIGTQINNQNTVFFAPNAGLKQGTTLNNVKNFYWVGRISSVGPDFYFMLGHDTNYYWSGSNYGSTYLQTYAAAIFGSSPASQYTTEARVVLDAYSGGTFGQALLPTNGTVALLSVNGITGTTNYQGLCYDRSGDCHSGWCGDLGEVLIFSNVLTTQQHQQVEGYLAWKWGLQSTLPSRHTYAKFSP
jgi:hypothetical protein